MRRPGPFGSVQLSSSPSPSFVIYFPASFLFFSNHFSFRPWLVSGTCSLDSPRRPSFRPCFRPRRSLPSTALSPSPPRLARVLARHCPTPFPCAAVTAPAASRPLALCAGGSVLPASSALVCLASSPANEIGGSWIGLDSVQYSSCAHVSFVSPSLPPPFTMIPFPSLSLSCHRLISVHSYPFNTVLDNLRRYRPSCIKTPMFLPANR